MAKQSKPAVVLEAQPELLAATGAVEVGGLVVATAESQPPTVAATERQPRPKRFRVLARHHSSPVKSDVVDAVDEAAARKAFALRHGIDGDAWSATITEVKS